MHSDSDGVPTPPLEDYINLRVTRDFAAQVTTLAEQLGLGNKADACDYLLAEFKRHAGLSVNSLSLDLLQEFKQVDRGISALLLSQRRIMDSASRLERGAIAYNLEVGNALATALTGLKKEGE